MIKLIITVMLMLLFDSLAVHFHVDTYKAFYVDLILVYILTCPTTLVISTSSSALLYKNYIINLLT